jgi:hypothetical protein
MGGERSSLDDLKRAAVKNTFASTVSPMRSHLNKQYARMAVGA